MKDKNEEIVAAIDGYLSLECEHEQGVHEVEQTGFCLDKRSRVMLGK